MSSEVIVGSNITGKGHLCFSRRPFRDICDRIVFRSISQGHVWLEKMASWGPPDNRLWIPELDDEGCDILIATLEELACDDSLFEWEEDWMTHPVNVERCRSQGITPEEEALSTRESTASGLRRFIELVDEKLRGHDPQ